MSEFQEFLNEQLQDEEFRKEWEDIQPEMDVIRWSCYTSISDMKRIRTFNARHNNTPCYLFLLSFLSY